MSTYTQDILLVPGLVMVLTGEPHVPFLSRDRLIFELYIEPNNAAPRCKPSLSFVLIVLVIKLEGHKLVCPSSG